ncbi:heat shock protein, class I [Richelia sinica FACHB-800]|uniref:Heat shock protein, class I n=1 Tax=Richelia sinica FACHB-800 TaxID=1357546 RepID=A0A975Y494_9NOST|nr:Hsp20/alpha crystallin family protein [Richelia sinica]MBD2666344.1 Hsp20/alpha crystallin family protein [Richelia sinica FACHB-800]QXE22950.1 heat shock protein, class I [Richelia sinica FACHB-800]
MALIRWEPFRDIERLEPFAEMDNLQRQMNRLFGRLIPPNGDSEKFSFVPAAELAETDHELHLRLEIPGLEPKDINVEVTTDSVSISGERKSETKTEQDGYTRSEFRYGRFQRVIPLPVEVQNEQVQAEYKDGILTLTLPKAEAERRKAIKVNIG